jgi:CBS domain-containing protein
MITAGDFCNTTVFIARPSDSLLAAARRMHEEHVGSLVVVEDDEQGRRPIGMITDRDILVRVLASETPHVGTLSVGDVMSRELVRAWDHEPLVDVLKRMRSFGIRRIPVVERSGHLLGIVTFDDLVEEVADQLHDLASVVGNERRREAQPEARVSWSQ